MQWQIWAISLPVSLYNAPDLYGGISGGGEQGTGCLRLCEGGILNAVIFQKQ